MAHLGCCELFIPDCTHSACLFTNLLKPSDKMGKTFLKLIYLGRHASGLASFFALLKNFRVKHPEKTSCILEELYTKQQGTVWSPLAWSVGKAHRN